MAKGEHRIQGGVVMFGLILEGLYVMFEWVRRYLPRNWIEARRTVSEVKNYLRADEDFWLALGESDPMTHRSTIGIHIAKDVATGGSIVLPITPDTPVNCLQFARAQRIEDPTDIFVYGYDGYGNRLYVRESAYWLWEEILIHKKEYFDVPRNLQLPTHPGLIVTGNNGIGKSMNLIIYIWHLLHPGPGQDRPTIVYQNLHQHRDVWVLKGAKYEDLYQRPAYWPAWLWYPWGRSHVPDLKLSDIVHPLGGIHDTTTEFRVSELLQDPSAWYIIQAPYKVSGGERLLGDVLTDIKCFTLCDASPNMIPALSNLETFKKDTATHTLIMPIWTFDEMEMARFCCHPTPTERVGSAPLLPNSTTEYVKEPRTYAITQTQMQLQFDIAGGVPRYILHFVWNKMEFEDYLQQWVGLSITLIEDILSNTNLEFSSDEIDWYIHRVVRVVNPNLHRHPTRLPFRLESVRWASQYLAQYFYERAVSIQSSRLKFGPTPLRGVGRVGLLPSHYYRQNRRVVLSCPICMDNFKAGDEVRHLPCPHQFHAECIDRWLGLNQHCPLCREEIVIPVEEVDVGESIRRAMRNGKKLQWRLT